LLDAEDGIPGAIDEIVYLGEIISARITLASGAQIWARRLANSALVRGASVRVGWAAQHLRVVAER
ncbi:MAG TPA: TOBE domain-containing protein, partial [Stellaceae bacterium]|nr:TOBE domain-containing protein [Stellaceae bacterium]